MARKVRIEYPGALYHVMSRGNQGNAIFRGDADRKVFLETLAQGCAKTGWCVHAYMLVDIRGSANASTWAMNPA